METQVNVLTTTTDTISREGPHVDKCLVDSEVWQSQTLAVTNIKLDWWGRIYLTESFYKRKAQECVDSLLNQLIMLGPKTPTDKELTYPAFKLHVYEEITNIELCTQIT